MEKQAPKGHGLTRIVKAARHPNSKFETEKSKAFPMSEDFRPLAGTRVVEMTYMIMGPSCGMFLALMGAEVIKIEPPLGDKTRNLTGMGSPFFPLFNRGKVSVQLDLSTDAGRDAWTAC